MPNVRFTSSAYNKYLRKETAVALMEMFSVAEDDGIILYAVSGYRSYSTQKAVFSNNVIKYGNEQSANNISAQPGQSEHQTGLSMDVTAKSVQYNLSQDFAKTAEGLWVKENAHRFGFIIRYLKGKEHITGYVYEPWHLRYVGDTASDIFESGLTMEEYYEK